MTPEAYFESQRAAMVAAEQAAPSVIEGWDLPSSIEIDYIDMEAVIAQLPWGKDGFDFGWRDLACLKFKQSHVIDFAIWYEGELHGLCCAFAWPNSGEICIEALQAHPDRDHKLRGYIIQIARVVLAFYGKLVGASVILVNQAEPGSEIAYLKSRFEPHDDGFAYVIPEGIQ